MFGIDDALADVVDRSTNPALAAIKLAWWREALERLDSGPVPAAPRLAAVASELVPRGVSGKDLASLEPGWATLLAEFPALDRIERRGAALFRLGAKLLGADDPLLDEAGRLFAVIDLGRRRRDDHWRADATGIQPHRFARRLRPLTALARLAMRDLRRGIDEPEATPGRAAALIAHRLTGRIA